MAPIGFQFKLWKILDAARSNSLIRWSQDGTAVVVDEASFDKLAVDYYPNFLRCPDMLNLRRMFHWYFFNRTAQIGVNGAEMISHVEYRHPLFIRGRTDLLQTLVSRYPAKRVQKNVDAAAEPGAALDLEFLPSSHVPRRRSLESPPNGSSMMSLKSLTLFRLPKCLKLDEDIADMDALVQRRPLAAWPPSIAPSVGTAKGSTEILFERRVRPDDGTVSYGFDAIVSSLPPPAFVDRRLFTVKLRNKLQNGISESRCEDTHFYVTKELSNDSENCRPTSGVTAGGDLFGDEVWFGLENEQVIEAVAFEECESSAWTESDAEAEDEPKLYTNLNPVAPM